MLLKNASFAIFDFETTGLYPYSGDKICEIAATRIDPGIKKRRKFHSMVDPERSITNGAFFVNGITEDLLNGAPTIDKILPDFLKFIEGSILVAYNAGFDLGFLECALGENKDTLKDYFVIDALALARRLFPGIRRYGLANVARQLGIPLNGAHRAMSDVRMTLAIFEEELRIFRSNGVETIEDVIRAQKSGYAFVKTVRDYKRRLIEEAIRRQKRLKIKYHSIWSNKITKRTITPKEIQKGYDISYVVAHCHLRDEERNFRLEGILEVKQEV